MSVPWPVIELQHLHRDYAVAGRTIRAVHDVSFTAGRGEFLSVVGPSGSGKSTLLALIGSILRPGSGAIRIGGVDPWTLPDVRRSRVRGETFGFIYQFSSLLPTLTARENILLPTLFGRSASPADADRLLELVGLQDRADHYPGELSGGEQRRVAVARACVNEPPFLLADEPTADLDEQTEEKVFAVLERYVNARSGTVILVTHSRALADRASRRFVMLDGVLAPRK